MSLQKAAQGLTGLPVHQIGSQQAFDRVWHILGTTTIRRWASNRGELSEAAAQTELIGIYHPAVYLDLLAF